MITSLRVRSMLRYSASIHKVTKTICTMLIKTLSILSLVIFALDLFSTLIILYITNFIFWETLNSTAVTGEIKVQRFDNFPASGMTNLSCSSQSSIKTLRDHYKCFLIKNLFQETLNSDMVEEDKIKRQKVTVMSPVSPLDPRTHQ